MTEYTANSPSMSLRRNVVIFSIKLGAKRQSESIHAWITPPSATLLPDYDVDPNWEWKERMASEDEMNQRTDEARGGDVLLLYGRRQKGRLLHLAFIIQQMKDKIWSAKGIRSVEIFCKVCKEFSDGRCHLLMSSPIERWNFRYEHRNWSEATQCSLPSLEIWYCNKERGIFCSYIQRILHYVVSPVLL